MEKRDLVIKITIPFCVKKCDYCTRQIVEGWDSQLLHAYMEAVQKEIRANVGQFSDYRVRALHFGGGLASMANAQDVSDIARLIKENYSAAEDIPVTIRASISNISEASMPFYSRAGITRFDFEMMSLSSSGYSTLNQRDSLGDLPVVADQFLQARDNGNLGIVLVYGSAEVGRENFRRSVVEFTRMSSAAHLILQEYEGELPLSEEEKESQREEAHALLADAGFVEYAPCHFARPGSEDLYTQKVEKKCEILAFGLGAISFIEGVWSKNTFDLEQYLAHSDDYSQITSDVKVNKAELQ